MTPTPAIPIVPKLQPDELLYSWMSRLARANGFERLNDFFDVYVWPELRDTKKKNQKICYDIRHDLYEFCESLDGLYEPLELFQKASMFCGISPLMSRSHASQHIGLMARRGDETKTLSIPKNMLTDLAVCPKCQQEDLEAIGDYVIYRAHQMPGVKVCYKHGCRLEKYIEIESEAPDTEEIELDSSSEDEKDAFAYAVFCHDMLQSGLQCDFRSFKKLIFSKELQTYTNHEKVLSQLMQQFGAVEEVKKSLTLVSQKAEFENAAEDRFTLLSPWREDVIELKCNTCGRRFITSPYRIISGWGCPSCDSVFSETEIFQRLFDTQNDGTYTLLSPFKGMSENITIHHITCGKTKEMLARNYIIENMRCECENRIPEEQARNAIETAGNGEFELISYEGSSKPIQLRHLKCRRFFCWDYHSFLKKPGCRLCNPRVSNQEMFVREIRNLVGNEYTLIGNYVDRTTKVGIRHNRCYHTQEYLPTRFLDGARCSRCTPEFQSGEIERIVREISFGRYIWGGHKTANLEIVKDTQTGTEKYMTRQRILQELLRPTPSPILPLKKRNENVAMPVIQMDTVYEWIRSRYSYDDLISLEDIKIEGINYQCIKNATRDLVSEGKFQRIDPGIFSFLGRDFTPEEVLVHRYLVRNGKRIGFLTDHSFAYELGLRDEKPARIGLVTNVESLRHGRNRTFMGMELKLHGSPIPVNDENYAILAVITFVLNEKRLKCCTKGNKEDVLKKWLADKNISFEDFEDYYQYYPRWTKNMIAKIYGETAK